MAGLAATTEPARTGPPAKSLVSAPASRAMRAPAATSHGDSHAEHRKAVQVVRRAVEGIDDPAHATRALASAPLLTQHAVVGALLLEGADDQRLRRPVDGGHHVGAG